MPHDIKDYNFYNLAQTEEGVDVALKTSALVCSTGEYTGRAAKNKFFVRQPETKDTINWSDSNQSMSEEEFDELQVWMERHIRSKLKTPLYSQTLIAGAQAGFQLPIRLKTESARHSLAAQHLFLPQEAYQTKGVSRLLPPFTIMHLPSCRHPVTNEAFIVINIEKQLILIGGTNYFGEIKKSVFTVMNYLLPAQGVLSMHCSANIGLNGDTALFFGLSGTGKTTLSADPERRLIGDDEHGWSDRGIFNIEGGCYAKCIKLSPEYEPEIWQAVNTPRAVLENVVMDDAGELDFDSSKITENSRAAYPLSFLSNVERSGQGNHPQNIIFLTCDACGVLPPIAKLTPEQARYHFLNGYTAKVAGTEHGVTEPALTFSACFGEPFMPRSPVVYADLLTEKIKKHNVKCWLVNTGWSGGPYGVGKRMSISISRNVIRAALNGSLDTVSYANNNLFELSIPASCPGVDTTLLDPRATWQDSKQYSAAEWKLINRFNDNYQRFSKIR